MILVADVGNTRLKWAFAGASGLFGHCEWWHRGMEAGAFPEGLWTGLPAPARVVACSVGPAWLEEAVEHAARGAFGVEVEWRAGEAAAHGVVNAYPSPQALGADRWAALVGARHLVSGACCVVDCGTAITVDVLDGEGNHQGGLILPGLGLMRQSLAGNTARLPAVADVGTPRLATDTGAGIAAGTLLAAAAAVERACADAERDVGAPLTGILTGGDAAPIAAALTRPLREVPDLVLRGLAVMGGMPP
jgi:type III pantothenate kinase